jgi:hypothetical protein
MPFPKPSKPAKAKAAAKQPEFARKVGVPVKAAKEPKKADKSRSKRMEKYQL